MIAGSPSLEAPSGSRDCGGMLSWKVRCAFESGKSFHASRLGLTCRTSSLGGEFIASALKEEKYLRPQTSLSVKPPCYCWQVCLKYSVYSEQFSLQVFQRLVLPKFYNWQREVRNISPLTLSRKTLLGKVAKIIDTAFSVRKGEGFEFMFLLFFKGTRHQLTGLRFPGDLFDILYYWVVSWRADLFRRLHLPQSVGKNE